MAVISVTEIESARRCGWQHDFNSRNRMDLEPYNSLHSLYTGTLWHHTLDSMGQREMLLEEFGDHEYIPNPTNENLCRKCNFVKFAHMKEPIYGHIALMMSNLRERYLRLEQREPTGSEYAPSNTTCNLVKAMITNYLCYYKGRTLPENFVYIQPEQQMYKVLPNTSHCTCYSSQTCQCAYSGSCRLKHSKYTYCKCIDTQCICRQDHIVEGTVDGLIRNTQTNGIFIWENKSFSVHMQLDDLKRLSQSMGYWWLNSELSPVGFVYNGAWTKTEKPENKTWKDMFPRYIWSFNPLDGQRWAEQAAITALNIFDPDYVPVRTVHPVGGCKGVNQCSFNRLCDARYKDQNYEIILSHEFTKRIKDPSKIKVI